MLDYRTIKGKILCTSGLHIHGSETGIKIGGIDPSLSIIRDPISELPYIPGSSLKGKIRFLLEHYNGMVRTDDKGNVPGALIDNSINEIAVIFGHLDHHKLEKEYYKHESDKDECLLTFPTRVIFHDSHVIGAIVDYNNEESINKQKLLDVDKATIKMNSIFSEEKAEVAIDRVSGTAKGGALRTVERVPAGTVFEFEIVLRVFKEGEQDKHIDILKQGLKLLENDALGGFGSRGSGRIKFFDLTLDGEKFTLNDVKL